MYRVNISTGLSFPQQQPLKLFLLFFICLFTLTRLYKDCCSKFGSNLSYFIDEIGAVCHQLHRIIVRRHWAGFFCQTFGLVVSFFLTPVQPCFHQPVTRSEGYLSIRNRCPVFANFVTIYRGPTSVCCVVFLLLA